MSVSIGDRVIYERQRSGKWVGTVVAVAVSGNFASIHFDGHDEPVWMPVRELMRRGHITVCHQLGLF